MSDTRVRTFNGGIIFVDEMTLHSGTSERSAPTFEAIRNDDWVMCHAAVNVSDWVRFDWVAPNANGLGCRSADTKRRSSR